MGTIEDKLRYLAKTKKDIMNALKSKGVEINESIPFSEYDTMVKSIRGGDVLLCKNMEELEEQGELSPGTLVMIYDEETDTFGGIYEATENGLQVLPTQLTANVTNVAPGIKAFGPNGIVEGTYTSDADATADDIFWYKTAYVNGVKLTGRLMQLAQSLLTYDSTMSYNTNLIVKGHPSGSKYSAYNKSTICEITVPQSEIANVIGLTSDQIVEGATVLGIAGTATSGGAITSDGIKQFATEEEMQADSTSKEGDLAIVYSEIISNMNSNLTVSTMIFPETIVLPAAVSTTISGYLYDDNNDYSTMCRIYLRANSFYIMDYYTRDYIVRYTSTDGITYTKSTDIDSYKFDKPMHYSGTWNDSLGYFMQVSVSEFNGLYKFGTKSFYNYVIPTANNISTGEGIVGKPFIIENLEEYIKGLDCVIILDETEELNFNGTIVEYVNRFRIVTSIGIIGSTGVYENGYIRLTTTAGHTHVVYTYENNVLTSTEEITVDDAGLTDINVFGCKVMSWYVEAVDNVYSPSFTYDFTSTVPCYSIAPSQLTLANSNELLPGKISYGVNGIVTGDDSIYDNLDYDKILEKFYGLEETYTFDMSAFSNPITARINESNLVVDRRYKQIEKPIGLLDTGTGDITIGYANHLYMDASGMYAFRTSNPEIMALVPRTLGTIKIVNPVSNEVLHEIANVLPALNIIKSPVLDIIRYVKYTATTIELYEFDCLTLQSTLKYSKTITLPYTTSNFRYDIHVSKDYIILVLMPYLSGHDSDVIVILDTEYNELAVDISHGTPSTNYSNAPVGIAEFNDVINIECNHHVDSNTLIRKLVFNKSTNELSVFAENSTVASIPSVAGYLQIAEIDGNCIFASSSPGTSALVIFKDFSERWRNYSYKYNSTTGSVYMHMGYDNNMYFIFSNTIMSGHISSLTAQDSTYRANIEIDSTWDLAPYSIISQNGVQSLSSVNSNTEACIYRNNNTIVLTSIINKHLEVSLTNTYEESTSPSIYILRTPTSNSEYSVYVSAYPSNYEESGAITPEELDIIKE